MRALPLAAAIPALFLHIAYQPSTDVDVAGASITFNLGDLAVAVVAAAAIAAGLRDGFAPLRLGRPLWAAIGALFAVILVSTAYGAVRFEEYDFRSHLVTALKFGEYAVLAPAVALLVRRREDLFVLLTGIVAWSVVASTVGLLQFLGFADEFEGRRPGQREPSWIGVHDFAAFSGAAASIALVALALGLLGGRGRFLAAAAWVSGTLGLVLAAALDAVAALAVSVLVLAVVAARHRRLSLSRALALGGTVAVVAAGALALRSADLDQFLRFLGIRPAEPETSAEVQTHAQRTLLLYIGGRIFLDHPVFGVGWQGSAQEYAFAPYLADAKARFPDQAERAFPAPGREWGVQNAFVQALADMGVIGAAALVVVFAFGLRLAGRAAQRGPPVPLAGPVALAWILFAAAVLAAYGLVAGIPTDALAWLGLGLAAATPEPPV